MTQISMVGISAAWSIPYASVLLSPVIRLIRVT